MVLSLGSKSEKLDIYTDKPADIRANITAESLKEYYVLDELVYTDQKMLELTSNDPFNKYRGYLSVSADKEIIVIDKKESAAKFIIYNYLKLTRRGVYDAEVNSFLIELEDPEVAGKGSSKFIGLPKKANNQEREGNTPIFILTSKVEACDIVVQKLSYAK